ncbi:MAG: 1-deoxy-D-xylulose-5-phosphate reductoisomerase [Treponema sp.]|jgi:1-deoxy-D-xylulose-5-phosphate reductoisomerase|nr:1-deoxy-D-xylulose-5-phosphate reductoisomerase [Treponema sp.]
MKKRIAVLGATGSIGASAIDIISRNKPEITGVDFEVVLLAARSNRGGLDEISGQFPKAVRVLACGASGKETLISAIKEAHADITVNGISGAAGLEPSAAAIESGSVLALANKETIVMAGNLIFRLAKEKNVKIIPVDSEHSAVFHLLQGFPNENKIVKEILLTASGGPFRNLSAEEMEYVKPSDALCHPTWKMGPKITIDSASMANKGLEIIEACAFFGMKPDNIRVVIHPQSIVHSMIRLSNGIIYAQLSRPDMRHPIHDALYWPQNAPSDLQPLDFDCLKLEFEKPDFNKFPMLRLAEEAVRKNGLYPCAYNAANETAVAAFLEKKIRFTDIPRVTEQVLQADWANEAQTLETILKADADARIKADIFIKESCSALSSL